MRLRNLGIWAVLLGLSLPVWAVEQPGAISGYVRNNTGAPQMGAVVQILGAANRTLTVFTDDDGYYTASGLLPGLYSLKVTAPSFLPAWREKVGLRSGASLKVNVTLSTLLGVMQLGPVRSLPADDDWKWTLRSVANRPILRVFDDPTSAAEKQKHELSGTLSFFAGSAAGGSRGARHRGAQGEARDRQKRHGENDCRKLHGLHHAPRRSDAAYPYHRACGAELGQQVGCQGRGRSWHDGCGCRLSQRGDERAAIGRCGSIRDARNTCAHLVGNAGGEGAVTP